MADLLVIPQGVREGVSEKTSKPYKFFSYVIPSLKKFASSATELKDGDEVTIITSDKGYINLVSGKGITLKVAE